MLVASEAVDSTWDEVICAAKRCAPAAIIIPGVSSRHRGIQGLVGRNLRPEAVNARVRRMRDEDIANADEGEIANSEKVLLLVSSCLNDKRCLPGHLFRYLIREHQKRERERRRLRWEVDAVVVVSTTCGGANSDNEELDADEYITCRTTREDTHAVIKHITATLLEARPVFGSSTCIAEMFATAVEALVFGEVYDLVFGEIVEQTREVDEALMIKISEFQIEVGRRFSSSSSLLSSSSSLSLSSSSSSSSSSECYDTVGESSSSSSSSSSGTRKYDAMMPNYDIEKLVFNDALKSLRRLPESHSVAEKLYHCVQFLGFIVSSSQFRTITHGNKISKAYGMTVGKEKKKTSIGAESLLKMVCQHIVVAKVPNLNAEIVFLEEFARDGQLLKGREAYALVTMISSLHFINASNDLGKDLFHDEDD